MEKILRSLFLFLSKNRMAIKLAKKHGLKLGANRFVGGMTLESAIQIAKELNDKGIMVTFDYLGEFVTKKSEVFEIKKECVDTLQAIKDNKIDGNLSVKLTSLGLDLSEGFCKDTVNEILYFAKRYQSFVRIDMEDFKRNAKTLQIFRELKEKYPNEVGVVIQAYLYKSYDDVLDLNSLRANLRICKGAYKESPEVAYAKKEDVDDNYKKLVTTHLSNGNYTAIATHDEQMITYIKNFVEEKKIPKSQFEFQMLYGIRNEILENLAKEGFRTRIYLPYGNDWYGYFMRRLAERPANVWFVLKNLK
jgi:proline dehydrogenase